MSTTAASGSYSTDDQLRRVLRGGLAVGDDERDRLAREDDLVRGQRLRLSSGSADDAEVRGGQDGPHSAYLERRAGVDRDDAGVGVGTQHRSRVQQPAVRGIGGIRGAAPHLLGRVQPTPPDPHRARPELLGGAHDSALRRAAVERALHRDDRELPPVPRVGVERHEPDGVERFAEVGAGPDRLLHRRRPQRLRGDAREPDRAAAVGTYADGGAGERIARRRILEGHIRRALAGRGHRHAELEEQLLLREQRRERPEEERLRRDLAVPVRAAEQQRRAGGDDRGGEVGRRVAVRERPADGARVPHLDVPHLRGAIAERSRQRRVVAQREQLVVGRERTDPDRAAVDSDTAKVEAGEVDQAGRPREAELHHREERVAAGDRLRFRIGELGKRLVERVRPDVVEGGRNHAGVLTASAAARTEARMPW